MLHLLIESLVEWAVDPDQIHQFKLREELSLHLVEVEELLQILELLEDQVEVLLETQDLQTLEVETKVVFHHQREIQVEQETMDQDLTAAAEAALEVLEALLLMIEVEMVEMEQQIQ